MRAWTDYIHESKRRRDAMDGAAREAELRRDRPRQRVVLHLPLLQVLHRADLRRDRPRHLVPLVRADEAEAVSYTHLTLPTKA